jgi:hypothetical protein
MVLVLRTSAFFCRIAISDDLLGCRFYMRDRVVGDGADTRGDFDSNAFRFWRFWTATSLFGRPTIRPRMRHIEAQQISKLLVGWFRLRRLGRSGSSSTRRY